MTDPIRTEIPRRPNPPAPTLAVQFFLRHGAVVHWPVPAGPFSLQILATNIRAQGFFISDDLYIPDDEIACIGMSGSPAKIQQPTHPTRQ